MDDPIARARALAEKLSQKVSSSSSSSSSSSVPQAGANATVLGKRSYRDESQVDSYSKRHKVFVPIDDFPDVNFPGLIFGPGGSTLKQLEAATGTRILLRGRGSQKNAPDDPNDEPMHVLIQADSDAAMEHAISKVNDLLHNPNAQKELKDQQLSTLTNFVSPLQKKEGNPNTFSLSSALYANDDGFHMMAPRVSPEQLREERLAAQRQVREGETQKDIFVEAEKVGLVIGRGGETIKSIQALTGVYIQVHKEAPGSYEPMRKITLKGTEAAIQAGEAEVIKCANGGRVGMDGPSSSSGGGGGGGGNRPGLGYNGGGNEETVQVPGSMIGLVIGRGGESIRAIQDRTGCMIQVQKDDNNPQNLRQVKLIGNPNAIAAARQAIDDIILSSRESGGGSHGSYGPPRDRFGGPPGIDGGAPGHYGGGGGGSWRPGEGGGGFRGGPLTGPGMVTVTVPVPNPVIPSLIGKGGEIIKRLQHVSSARIQISRDEGQDFRNVIVSGRPEHCDTAKREIEQIIAVKSTPGGIVDANSIGAGPGYGPPGGYGGPRGGYGGYSGPPQHGYGAPYNGPPSGPYGGPPQHGAPYGADPYGAPPSGVDPYGGAPPGVSTGPSSAPGSVPPSAPAPVDEVAVPEPPTDPTAFESWWGTLSIPQQTAYYKKYYPEMLSQLPQAQ